MTSACLPSKVLHIRHLPEECTEMDIRAMSAPFGYVRQVLFLSQKQQAFVEFSSIEEAAMMLATCQTNVIRLGSRTLAAQFSNKQEITIPTRPLTDPSTVAECPPSKVLHLRNLPEECTELDIHTVSCPFGLIRQVLFLSRKQQAFVEFSTVEEATSMLVSSKAQPIRIGTRALIAQYSNKQVVTVPAGGAESADATSSSSSKPGGGGQGKILLITVTNVQFPVTLEVVYQVFGMCGAIAKAVVFNRQGKDQALVQYHRPQDAALAMSRFQGKNMYSGCNSLNIQYSKLPDVTVKVNNERACDFTHGQGLLTAAAFAASANGGGLLSAGGLGLAGGMTAFGGGAFPGDFSGGGGGGFPSVGAGFGGGGGGGGFGGFGGGGGFDAFGMGGGGMGGGFGGGGGGGGGGGPAGMGQGFPFPGAGGFGDPGPGFKRPYEAMGGYDGLDDGRRARPAGW